MADLNDMSSENSMIKVFNRCRDALTRSILKMSVKPEDVDDILQETFLRAFSANQKKKIKSPQGYLFVISRNLVIRRASNRSKAIKASIDSALYDDEPHFEQDFDAQQRFGALNEAMNVLPKNTRQAILLRKVYGFSSQEIANKMNISKSSVNKYIAEGIRHCEQSLCARGYAREEASVDVIGNIKKHTSSDKTAEDKS